MSTQKVAADLPDQNSHRWDGLAWRMWTEWEQAIRQYCRWLPRMTNPEKAERIESGAWVEKIPVHSGEQGLIDLATMPEADIVLVAIVGTAGLEPALAAIRAGKDLAVASKEILVHGRRTRDE